MQKTSDGSLINLKSDLYVNENNIAEILLKNRGYTSEFFQASLRTSMPDPYFFVDMEKAVTRIYDAIIAGQPIAILGDYDVDGISSTCLLLRFFKEIGVQCEYTIPNRMDEGYGLSILNIEKYKNYLIIAVDCGSSSATELAYAKENNIDVIVIDHHKMNFIPEGAVAIVNPHRPDENGQFTYLCAGGVTFICLVGLNRLLKERNFMKHPTTLKDYLDLAALATVCDSVPLVDLNRAFVINGLKVIQQKKNLGISALLALGDKNEITSETIAFFIGPHLNAAGRLSTADISVRLIMSENSEDAICVAQELFALNKERQELEASVVEEIISSELKEEQDIICAFNSSWHVGVIGIAAGRLKEKYNKPAIVISCDRNGAGKASCRSVDNLDISQVVKKAIEKGIISSGGGHFMAAGFTIPVENIPALKEFLNNEIIFEKQQRIINVDARVTISDVSFEFIRQINSLAPFGEGNRAPLFLIPNVRIASRQILKDQHISAMLMDDYGCSIKGIAFRCIGSSLGDILLDTYDKISVLGELSVSTWRNNKYLNLLIKDAIV